MRSATRPSLGREARTAKPRGDAAKAFAAAAVRHEAEYFIPIEHHNPMELYASTVVWEGGGKLTVYDKTQGVQNVQRYLCSVFDMKPDDVRVMSPFVGGAFGSGFARNIRSCWPCWRRARCKRSVRLVLTRQQMYALGYRPATIQRLALGANADGTLDAITHEAIAVTSQYEDFSRNDTGWSGLLYKCANAKYAHKLARLDLANALRHARARRGDRRLCARMRDGRARRRAQARSARAALRCYSDRDQNDDVPYTSKELRECYRQGAEAFGWDKRNPEPRSMRDGGELVGWGMATGIWEALQMPIAVRIVLTANGHAEVACATSDIGTGTYTIMAQVAADMLGLPLDNVTVKLGDSTLPQVAGRGRIVDRGLGVARDRDDSRCGPQGAVAAGEADAEFAACGRQARRRRSRGRQDRQQATTPTRAVSIADAMRHGGVDRIEQEKATDRSRTTASTRATRIRRSSPR